MLHAAFGGWPHHLEGQDPAEFFHWKHLANPFGRSTLLVAHADETIIGFGAWLRWRVTGEGRTLEIMRGVDLAVDPGHQGRGVFTKLLAHGPEHFPPGAVFTFSNPNVSSRPGTLNSGRREVGKFPVFVRPCHPVRAAIRVGAQRVSRREPGPRPLAAADPAAAALSDGAGVSSLLSEAGDSGARLTTAKDITYLRWRYCSVGDHRAISEHRAGRLAGLAIFRVRRRGRLRVATVCELLVARGDRSLARRILRRVRRATAADYLTCHFPSGSTPLRAAVRVGFLRTHRGVVATIYPLTEQLGPDPTDRDSWALCLGDLDLL